MAHSVYGAGKLREAAAASYIAYDDFCLLLACYYKRA